MGSRITDILEVDMNEEFDNRSMLTENDSGAERNAEPPIESQVVKKKSLSKRIAGALMSEDYRLIFQSIYQNIIDPAIKKIAVEAFRAFVYRGKTQGSGYDEYTDYQSYHSGGGSTGGSEMRIKQDFGEIQYRSRESAERVLDIMRNKLRKEGLIYVADYYKISGQTPQHTFYNYGWTNLNAAYIYHYSVKGERVWGIHLPEPMYVDRT